jgi:putative transposase
MTQVARNVTDMRDGFLRGKRYLLLDRDTKYSDAFRGILTRAGIEVVRLPPAITESERVRGAVCALHQGECLSRMMYFGQTSLRHAITQYLAPYHHERNHQGLGNRLLIPSRVRVELDIPVKRRERLGGMLSYYHREVA